MQTDLLNRYGGIATYLGLDLVAIFLMTYVLYFRRHCRADLLLSYVALNIGIFFALLFVAAYFESAASDLEAMRNEVWTH